MQKCKRQNWVALTASSVKAASEQPFVIPVSRLAPYSARVPLRVEEGGVVPEGQVLFFLWSTGHRCFWGVGRVFCGIPVTNPEIDEDLWGKWTPHTKMSDPFTSDKPGCA